MSNMSQQIVHTLWRYCNILRDDGLSYPDYVEQLTYLLFLKMAYEQRHFSSGITPIPPSYDWASLVSKTDNVQLHQHYSAMLQALGGGPGMLGIIFDGAKNKIRDPAKLSLLVNDLIDTKNWTNLDVDVKGAAYEGLLEKNAQDTKSGAGQYFTPRPVVQAVIDVIQPSLSDRICDPACGSCGFLLAAVQYIRACHPTLKPSQRNDIRLHAIHGVELVPAVARLGAMNLFLHGIGPLANEGPPPIGVRDSLQGDPGVRYQVVVTNPPFGRKSSVTVLREVGEARTRDLVIERQDFCASTSNKQLNFVQHVLTILARPGRAAIVVPDNVLFEGRAGEAIRRRLLCECNVHTLLRLPSGIFYAGGVKANVLFFEKMTQRRRPQTRKIWVYDLRTNFRVTLRTNPLRRTDLDEFVECYNSGNVEGRIETWSNINPTGRWRSFDYADVARRRDCNLDILWLGGETQHASQRSSPMELATEIVKDLRAALAELELIAEEMKR